MTDSHTTLIQDVFKSINTHSDKHGEYFLDTFKSPARSEVALIDDLNRYFNMQLSLLTADTLEARECLLAGISSSRWLSYFNSHVVTLLVRFQKV